MSSSDQNFALMHAQLSNVLDATFELVQSELGRAPESIQLAHVLQVIERVRRKMLERRFRIAALALTKSGKSTLLNAFLGDEYLPAANTPETANTVCIRLGETRGSLDLGNGQQVHGARNVNDHLRALNKRARAGTSSERRDLQLTAPLVLKGIDGMHTHGLEILDTPGPNEAGVSEGLRNQIIQMLEEVDAIIYVLDYTKLKTEEEASLLSQLAEMRPELVLRCSERLFFAVNKMDTEDRNGLSQDDTRTYVVDLLRRTLPQLNVQEDRILPISANNALLARMIIAGNARESALNDFRQIAFGKMPGPTKSEEECHAAAIYLLKYSGIETLEHEVLRYVLDNRGRLFHQSLAEELRRCVEYLDNYFMTAQGTLQINRESLESSIETLKSEIKTLTESLQQVTLKGQEVKSDVTRWTREKFAVFGDEVRQLINELLNVPPPSESRKGPLRQAWETIRDLFSDGPNQAVDVSMRLAQADCQVQRLVDREFVEFQSQLQQEAFEKQNIVMTELIRLVSPIMRSIESKVNRTLEINLRPVPLAIPLTSLRELQDDISRFSGRFFVTTHRTEHHMVATDHHVPGGFCTPPRTVQRHSIQPVTVAYHSISREEFQQYWLDRIARLTDGSVRTASAFLDEAFKTLASRVRGEVELHASGFIRTIEAEIYESEKDHARREKRISEVRERKRLSEGLLSQVQRLGDQLDESRIGDANADNLTLHIGTANIAIKESMTKNEANFHNGLQMGVSVGGGSVTLTNSTATLGTADMINDRSVIARDEFEKDVIEVLGMLVDAKEELQADYESIRVAMRKLNTVHLEESETVESVRAKADAVLDSNDKYALRKLGSVTGAISANILSSAIWDYALKPLLGG